MHQHESVIGTHMSPPSRTLGHLRSSCQPLCFLTHSLQSDKGFTTGFCWLMTPKLLSLVQTFHCLTPTPMDPTTYWMPQHAGFWDTFKLLYFHHHFETLSYVFLFQVAPASHPDVGLSMRERKKVKVVQLCPTLCDPTDYMVHRILQARILQWVTFPFSRGSSQPRDQAQVSLIAGRFFTSWPTREAQEYWSG